MFKTTPLELFDEVAKVFRNFPKTEEEVKEFFVKLQRIFYAEAKNSIEMWQIYQKSLTGNATPNEINKANKIAQDLAISAGFIGLLALPGSLFFLPVLIKGAKEFGIDLVPATIKEEFKI
jgi:hypothetical protein